MQEEIKTQEEVKTGKKNISFLEIVEKQLLNIESNKRIIINFFLENPNLKTCKIFVVRSQEKTRENYYEIFFDFGALGVFAQKSKNLSKNQDLDLIDAKKESRDYFRQMYYEVYEVECVDISLHLFEVKATHEKRSLETMEVLKK